jgi:hypothetical protein
MSDLVERLRERKLFKGAADEIERLTGERDRQYDKNCEQIIRIASLEAEIERLRNAVSLAVYELNFVAAEHGCEQCATVAQNIASVSRAALEGK